MCDHSSNSKIIKCKAAVLWRIGEAELEVKEIEVDPPKSNEVRIKMLCASLCHTDVLCCGGFPLPLFPRVPGHEGVGMVESVGEGVKRTEEVKVGDIVMPTYVGECGKCENCESSTGKKTNLCRAFPLPLGGLMPDGTTRMSIGGQRIYQHFSCSTFSEYTVVDVNYVVKVDPRVPLPLASLLSCGYSTGFGAAWKEALLREESTVAVLGLGAVGLGVVEGARTQGVSRIIGVDINENKRERGKVFGMTDFINSGMHPDKPISDLVKQLTDSVGVDYCFECTGVPALVNEAIESTKEGTGTAIIIGAGTKKGVEINRMPLLLGRTVKGCIFGGIKVKSDIPILFDKTIAKELNLDQLLTHQVSLDEINEAFQLLMKHPDCLKVLIKF